MITYAVTTHDEGKYLEHLMAQLNHKLVTDEIVIVDDYSTDCTTRGLLEIAKSTGYRVFEHSLEGDFATHKNQISQYATGEYIFQIDADELLSDHLLFHVDEILEQNPQIDVFHIPRINKVAGLTPEDIARWGWTVNEEEWVMWPDYQARIYKNIPDIQWKGKVHETLVSTRAMVVGHLPPEANWALLHYKEIERQRSQNEFYATL